MMKVGNHGQNETVDRAMSHTVRHKKMLLTRLKKIQGHLTDHVVKEPEETQREADLETVMQVIKSYLK